MKAMILAAGKGTRVRPITYTTPKPMIQILQKPVMEFLLELLKQHGFTEIMVNVSHLAHEIENYFRDGQRFGVQIAYSFEGSIVDGELVGSAVGSAGGMRRIQDFSPFFDDTFIVLCGDALIDLDLTEAVRQHRAKGSIATIITKSVPREEVSSYGIVVTDETGRVKAFQEKPKVEEALSTNISTGIYILSQKFSTTFPLVWNMISAGSYSQSWLRSTRRSTQFRWTLSGLILAKCPTTGRQFAMFCAAKSKIFRFPGVKWLPAFIPG